ncbi:NAD(P)-binding protein [Ceraceosorus guamensis]|uniref:NAD(P)-binding protein n=1 Tax=Ceraceosorus guamensis TaxID=1522189 RepID=A0A316W6S3_9BASI|nr:NAD(P)-binding protein [Ceraceosorus guamensis]PWN44818.1 NAD(P)-binding protein [Ceraceosorus guamensis]
MTVIKATLAAALLIHNRLGGRAPLHGTLPERLAVILRSRKLAIALLFYLIAQINTWLDRVYLGYGRRAKDAYHWPQEIAVVTGGSGGLGRRIASGLAAKGTRVAVLDIAAPEDGAWPSSLASRIQFYQTDLTDANAIRTVAEEIRSAWGHPTILVNNAGVPNAGQSLLHAEPSRTKLTLEVNLLASFYTIHEFLPDMVKHDHGHVVNVASAASFISGVKAADYAASKAGLLALNETLRIELQTIFKAPSVLTTIVHPSFIRTPMTRELFKSQSDFLEADEVVHAVVSQVHQQRSANLFLPNARVRFGATFRAFPTWLQDHLRLQISRGLLKRSRVTVTWPPNEAK